MNKFYGFFAHVLVNINLLSDLLNQIMVEGQDLCLLLMWSMKFFLYSIIIVK